MAMAGRFGVDSRGFLRWNGRFTLLMVAVDALVLHLFETLG